MITPDGYREKSSDTIIFMCIKIGWTTYNSWLAFWQSFKEFYWPKRDEKMYKKVCSNISVYNTINREEIGRSRRWYTTLAFFLVCAWLYKFVVWMLTVYFSEMSVLCECEIVLVWSDWRMSVWGVGVKLKYEVLVWSLEHVKGLGELGYVRGEEKRMEGCV